MPLSPEVTEAENFCNKARLHVMKYFNDHVDKTDGMIVSLKDIYVVWFCKTLQNWKALVSTTIPDGMYYEVTYNGDKRETYLDVYKKFHNVCIKDDDVIW